MRSITTKRIDAKAQTGGQVLNLDVFGLALNNLLKRFRIGCSLTPALLNSTPQLFAREFA